MTLSLTLFVAFTSTFLSLVTLNKFAPAIGLLDQPSSRKVHKSHTPLTGGIAIALGVSLTVLMAAPTITDNFLWILIGAFLMVLTGAYDDLKTLPVTHRFLIQSAVAIIVMAGGNLQITNFGTYPVIGTVELGYLSFPITLFAILTGINSLNLIDGLDGLASGLCFVAFTAIGVLASIAGHFEIASLAAIFCMALIGFLSKNMRFPWQKSAKAFLGDAGSTALGFTLACLVIHGSSTGLQLFSPTTALWILAIPIIDTLSVIIRRRQTGQHAFKASKDHLHHILLERYQSVPLVVNLMILGAIATTSVGIFLDFYGSDVLSLTLFISLACIHHVGANLIRHSFDTEEAPELDVSNQDISDTSDDNDQAAA